MKILITGATGFVGKALTNELLAQGHEINILSRDQQKAKLIFQHEKVKTFEWKNVLELPPANAFDGISGVINLMGENIAAKRWSEQQKQKLIQSRVDATKNLVMQIENSLNKPLEFFISSSAIGIYPTNINKDLTEESPSGHNFLANLCKNWEDASLNLKKTKRRVIIRTGVVLEKSDGALKKMLPPFIMGAGGPIGNGDQVMSWIHLKDLVNIFLEAIANVQCEGIYNAVSPHPVTNFDFTKSLGRAIHRPTLFPVPTLALKLAFGEMSSVILDSQKVLPKRLNEAGFQFMFQDIDSALANIFSRKITK